MSFKKNKIKNKHSDSMAQSESKQSGKALYLRLLKQIAPYWPLFLITIIGNALYSGIDSYAAYLFKPVLDQGFIGKDAHYLHILPLIIIGLFLGRGICGVISNYTMGWLSKRVVYLFRKDIFTKLMRLPASYYDQVSSGQLLAKITYNVDQVAQCNNDTLTVIVRQGCLVIGLFFVMFFASWQLTLLIFLVFPFVIGLIHFASKRFRKLSRRIQRGMGGITQAAEENITGYKEIRIFEAQEYQQQSFMKLLDFNFLQEMKLNLAFSINTPLVQLFGALALALVIYVAFNGYIHGLTPGSFIAMFSAMIMVLNPIKNLTKVNSTIQRGLAAAESIYGLLDEPEELEDKKDLEKNNLKNKLEFNGHLELKNLSFSYPGSSQNLILKNISFKISPGQTIALVGRSGSGKSTLVALIAGFYQPSTGEIFLDQHNIQDLSLRTLRSQVSIVSQHVNLFNDSIFHNIAFGNLSSATEDLVIQAAKAANAWEFIQDLPEGLKTQIGENGLKLSGGQRQRIAIARAILKNAPILILDEATSALDNESERAVKDAIENLKQGRTTLLIAHRLSTIESADQIIVLDQGEIKESGTHSELMMRNGLYKNLHQSALV